MPNKYDVAIVGAGIIGLAHAYCLAKRGKRVLILERGQRALGASVRNFGMIWPIGQPSGEMRGMAVRSREIWLEVLGAAGIWHRKTGSLHLAYREDEVAVLEEFISECPDYGAEMISPETALTKSPPIRKEGLVGAMWSPYELCVNPRQVVAELPEYLRSIGVEILFGTAVSAVEEGKIEAGGEVFHASQILLCTGDDFEALFPKVFSSLGMTRSKLQMLKARPRQPGFQIGTHLCAGLTLGHYGNFRDCKSLPPLLKRFESEYPEHVRWGIHLLVSQHENGELTIGDSHEYGLSPDPFLREEVEQLIFSYLDTFLPVDSFEITERWSGVYAKHPVKSYLVEEILPEVVAVTGVGGAGMTLSFGLADQVIGRLFGH